MKGVRQQMVSSVQDGSRQCRYTGSDSVINRPDLPTPLVNMLHKIYIEQLYTGKRIKGDIACTDILVYILKTFRHKNEIRRNHTFNMLLVPIIITIRSLPSAVRLRTRSSSCSDVCPEIHRPTCPLHLFLVSV